MFFPVDKNSLAVIYEHFMNKLEKVVFFHNPHPFLVPVFMQNHAEVQPHPRN